MKKFPIIILFSCFVCAMHAQWQKIDLSFEPRSLSVVDSNIFWTFNNPSSGGTFNVARSVNGGTTWTTLPIPTIQGTLLSGSVLGIDANTAWIIYTEHPSYNKSIYKTIDGGETWVNQVFFPQIESIIYFKFHNANNGIMVTRDFSNHVFIYTTTNAGQNWAKKTLNFAGSPLGVTTFGQDHIWIFSSNGTLWRSTDNGQNWNQFLTGFDADNYGLAMSFADNLNGMASVDLKSNQMVRTSDGGQTWIPVSNAPHSPPSTETFIWGISTVPNLPGAWVIGSNSGTAFTLDSGASWTQEQNFPDFAFGAPIFLNDHQGWALGGNQKAFFRWKKPLNTALGCVQLLSPLTGVVKRTDCNRLWFEGSIRADISNDTGLHVRAVLRYPDNTNWFNKQQVYNNIRTGAQDGSVVFTPDLGQTTIGEIKFKIPILNAFDTAQTILCTVSPTSCLADSSNVFDFHTGYFAYWFHPECFQIDTSNCAIELKTNVCGNDTNQYLIYYRVQNGPGILGNRYERNPSYHELVTFYIFAEGDYTNSTCYESISALYTCGTSNVSNPDDQAPISIQISPNPASESVMITTDMPTTDQIQWSIKNISGQTIYQNTQEPVNPSTQVNTSNWPAGFYLVEFWDKGLPIATKKLIIARD